MLLESGITEAFVGGVSVVEIGRVLGIKPGKVHSFLVKHQAIEALTEKPASNHACNGVWLQTLDKYGLSLERWCMGWGFGLADALDGMNGKGTDEVQDALMRDFPTQFKLVFRTNPDWKLKIVRERGRHHKYQIEWVIRSGHYVCTVECGGDLTKGCKVAGTGFSPTLALADAECNLKKSEQLRRLNSAVVQAQGRSPHMGVNLTS